MRKHLGAAAGCAVAFLVAACAPLVSLAPPNPGVPPSPDAYWSPPRGAAQPPLDRAPSLPEELRTRRWGLTDVLDWALRNNPSTRVSWQAARAALARYEEEQASYLPNVTLDAGTGVRGLDNSETGTIRQGFWGPTASLSWLLLDLGARAGAVEQARQSLLAADWSHNRAVQDLVLQVSRSYYGYQAAKALRQARLASLESGRRSLEAAQQRHEAGIATIADVLQARTALAQAKLALQTAEGTIETARGALAASMGLPAHTTMDTEDLPRELPPQGLSEQVGALIAKALEGRPDLAAARAQVMASEAQLQKIRADGLPTLSISAVGGATWFGVSGPVSAGNGDRREVAASAGLLLRYPLFTGGAQTSLERGAEADVKGAREQARSLEQAIALQVFTAYHALRTSAERVIAAAELLESAEQSEAVALGRYREGVGTILDLVSTQAATADANSQLVQARSDWYAALVQLAHDTGLLGLRGEVSLELPAR